MPNNRFDFVRDSSEISLQDGLDDNDGHELTDFDMIRSNGVQHSIISLQSNSVTLSSSSSSASALSSSFHAISSNKGTVDSTFTIQIDEKDHGIHLLGRKYQSAYNGDFQLDQASLFWFTYRNQFAELMPYGLTSDAGWGCMLRASQMMLAQALRLHFQGRDWLPSSIQHTPPMGSMVLSDDAMAHDDFTSFIANAFADYPGPHFPFSIQNMVATGLRYDKLPGEWYGPGTAAHVIKDLVSIYQNHSKHSHQNFHRHKKDLFKVMVVQEGCVFKNDIEEFMTEEGLISSSELNVPSSTPPSNDISCDTVLLHPLHDFQEDVVESNNTKLLQWDASLLLIIPLRLGLRKFNTDYSSAIADFFSLHQCVGMIGGSPRHALWFYGASRDDNTIYGLDPHTVQQTPPLEINKQRQTKRVVMSHQYMSSLHPTSYHNPKNLHSRKPVCMDVKNIDPSLALAFYCRDRKDFDDLYTHFESRNKNENYSLFSIMDSKPNYNGNLSFMVDGDDCLSDEEKKKGDDDDDEYIFL